MASVLEEELSCPVCRDVFSDPVFLPCSHSFCRSCLQRWWRGKDVPECPVCKRAAGTRDPPCNLALKNTCTAFLLERDRASAAGSADLCSLHGERLKLFCRDHREPVCLVCRDSDAHQNHRFRPVDEAARGRREALEEVLAPVREKLELHKQVRGNLDRTAAHIRAQVQRTERQIRTQFEKLHRFLQEEEEARLTALRDEEEQKSRVLARKVQALADEMASLSEVIRATEEVLRARDVVLLRGYEAAAEGVRRRRLPEPPALDPGALIDEARQLGNLGFNIWNRMRDTVSRTPVILDPNSAEPGLVLSDDLTGVRRSEKRALPGNPERFECQGVVLAAEGFDSGRHGWVVDVGAGRAWFVGVATESFRRKGRADLRTGLWAVCFSRGTYVLLSPTEPRCLRLGSALRAVGVRLDLDGGTLSFWDAETRTCIHTTTQVHPGKLFPVFYTGSEVPLKILPQVFDDGEAVTEEEGCGDDGCHGDDDDEDDDDDDDDDGEEQV
ncbi:nuclear factor 7, ovary-like [Cololabis saira]|uniref:nuclear factor 7, ovary-like n=1 Tax=Cololabis saira TaxID=129043 RepID=UPI002AD56902|nr:nuclear factor 7, ovary-like [Cololabis saira]